MSTTTLIPLAQADRPECGGKARGLARLIGAGLRVPAGFVIVDPSTDPGELSAAYAELGAGKVAVRSSALGEDGEQASFAGQYQTLLDVDNEQALGEAIERCFAATGGAGVRAYSQALADVDASSSMAVVVQRMVDARVAGVLFTCDPVTGADDRWIVEAVAGLGDALVSGRARPDRYRIDRREHGEIERELVGDAALLDDGLLAALLEQAERAVAALGGSLDLE